MRMHEGSSRTGGNDRACSDLILMSIFLGKFLFAALGLFFDMFTMLLGG